ncbi:MAG: hypothetical protein ABW119_16275, partial [Candidatus Thiodiazotropha lotti]
PKQATHLHQLWLCTLNTRMKLQQADHLTVSGNSGFWPVTSGLQIVEGVVIVGGRIGLGRTLPSLSHNRLISELVRGSNL